MSTALAILRLQPLTRAHTGLINRMVEDNDNVILGLGSVQISGTQHDPWTQEQRTQMIRNVYGDRVKILPLRDMGFVEPSDWCTYVLDKIQKIGMPTPTDYYGGSAVDTLWYRDYFTDENPEDIINHIRENDERYHRAVAYGQPDVIEECERYRKFAYYISQDFIGIRRLHILDRSSNPWPPATDVRAFLSLGNDTWRKWVPGVNADFIEDTYPDELRVPSARKNG